MYEITCHYDVLMNTYQKIKSNLETQELRSTLTAPPVGLLLLPTHVPHMTANKKSVIPVPGDQMPSIDLHGHCVHIE